MGADLLGYVASALVLATFCMRAMVPLRILAIFSNLAFIAYGYEASLLPILLLHLVLLPVNLVRLAESRGIVAAQIWPRLCARLRRRTASSTVERSTPRPAWRPNRRTLSVRHRKGQVSAAGTGSILMTSAQRLS